MTRFAPLLAALVPLAAAFSNTAPLLTWSSERSSAIEALPPAAVQASSILNALLSNEEICSYDAVVLVQQRGLHASDLRNLSPQASDFLQFLKSSPSSRSFQYLVNDDPSSLLSSRGRDVAAGCQSRVLQYSLGDSGVVLDQESKHVISLHLPDLIETGTRRRGAMWELARALSNELAFLAKAFPNHLVVYSGVPMSALSTRASPAVLAAGDTLPSGGILKRYQLLTPGLITVLLVIFFILIPVLLIGIKALAGIQSPIKMDMPRSYNAQERKNQ